MDRKGFTLVEIMIVVAIIALLAAIAIPNLLRARLNANEAAAQSTLKTISTACESYRAAQTVPTYPTGDSTVAGVGGLTDVNPAYLDAGIFLGAGRQGYIFNYDNVSANEYVAAARPANPNVTGIRCFGINESGVLRADPANAAITDATYDAATVVQ
ncbi:MAG: prepilin-type N-terminal cleavage/methylation domain-containing protein [Candidatus Omnitrophota bacterium]